MFSERMFSPMARRLNELQSELDLLRLRYRGVSVPPELDRLQLAMGRRQARADHLRGQVASLLDEVSRIEAEIAGCRKGYEALLADTVERIKRDQREGWSPFPVLGFRLWGWRDGLLHGAWQPWKTTSKTATCGRGNTEVPHSDGRCGRLGCGIYATKDLSTLLHEHTGPNDHGYLAGMVELTGKVVEHENGYRAARAEVVAGVLVSADRILPTCDPAELDEVFRRPGESMEKWGRARSATVWDEIERFMAPASDRGPSSVSQR
jgi:hypothetical protein